MVLDAFAIPTLTASSKLSFEDTLISVTLAIDIVFSSCERFLIANDYEAHSPNGSNRKIDLLFELVEGANVKEKYCSRSESSAKINTQ